MAKSFLYNLKDSVKKSDNFFIKKLADLYVFIYKWCRNITAYTSVPIFLICRILPQQDKIVATAFNGRKYGDNPQYIVEKIHEKNKDVKIVWLKKNDCSYKTPNFIKEVSYRNYWRTAYEMATAKIWINSHRVEHFVLKQENQTFIETWHGGLGVKKLELDLDFFRKSRTGLLSLKKTNRYADVFISNSCHLTKVYRTAFRYQGPVWEIGYPKNDVLFLRNALTENHNRIREFFSIPNEAKILVYAPTFRDYYGRNGINENVYSLDYSKLKIRLEDKFGGEWVVLIRLHPFIANLAKHLIKTQNCVMDATQYPDSQELILGADAFISDYSSMIFDAAMTNIPCFTYAKDYVEYKNSRGLYYNLEDLPFPLATTNEELMNNIKNYDSDSYHSKWDAFKKQMGLVETDSSAEKIADLVNDVIKNGKKVLVNYNFKT